MSAHNIDTGLALDTPLSLYQRVLGPAFHRLAPALTRLHGSGIRHLRGTLTIRIGANPFVRFLMRWVPVPRASRNAPCTVALIPAYGGERWQRQIGRRHMVTRQVSKRENVIAEHIGPLTVYLFTEVYRGGLRQRALATALFGIPLPKLFALQVSAFERALSAEAFYCDVRVRSPLLGALLHYRGSLRFETYSPVKAKTTGIERP